jgi:long-chain acyl-CoA synthetase
MDFTRLFDILPYQQLRYPQKNALAGRGRDGSWRTWSTEAALSERDRLSAGLLQMGFRKGDCVGMLTHCGSPEWVIADAAMMQIGIVPVPIHATARLDEIAHITRDAHLRACWVSNLDLYKKFVMAGESTPPAPIPLFSFESIEGAVSWNEIACDPDQHDLEKIEYYRQGIRPEDLATLLYTSGTTGAPKGVMLSHYNIVSNIKSVMAIVPIDRLTTTVSYLPMSHIFERTVCYLYQAAGASVWFADAVETLPQTLREVRPHFFTAVPRILERTYERLLEMRSKSGFIGKKVLDWAIKLGQNYPFAGAVDMPFLYRMQWMLADALVYRRWRKAMGGRLKGIAVGAAALQPRLGRLFSAAGIDVREGYGLTETSPVISFNRFEPGGVHFGTVGIPLPGLLRFLLPGRCGVSVLRR